MRHPLVPRKICVLLGWRLKRVPALWQPGFDSENCKLGTQGLLDFANDCAFLGLTMWHRAFQTCLLLASLTIAIGANTSFCEFINLFGLDVHHHESSRHHHCAEAHDHDSDRAPCPEECESDITDANIPKTVSFPVLVTETILPLWQDSFQIQKPFRTEISDWGHCLSSRRPPPAISPPVSGRFLI